MVKVIKVTGNSLSPFFLSGDYVVVSTARRQYPNLRKGQVVVANHPTLGLLIKRILRNDTQAKCVELEGTHPDSISSAKIGLVAYQDLVGKVLVHIKRPR
jgi:phage repressor protein C with HTH and peptisase S24 domain